MSGGRVVLSILGTILIIVAAYYVTYFIGARSIRSHRQGGRSIILRDRFAIAKDKSFCLVEIKGRVYVVGVTNNNITLLDTLKVEEFVEEDKIKAAQSEFYNNIPGFAAAKISTAFGGIVKKMSKDKTMNKKESSGFYEAYKAASEKQDTVLGPEGKRQASEPEEKE